MRRIIIGSRGSKLALRQTELVAEQLQRRHQGLLTEIKVIHTQGDKILDVALSKIGDKGLFTKELELALLSEEIDLAVHSMKDVPTLLPDGLEIGAVLEREDTCDVLISVSGKKIKELQAGARVGTSSLRRRAQLLAVRPDLQIVDLRGNLETRVRKMTELGLDAIVLARAGLKRMQMDNLITEILEPDIMLPAAGQGAMAIEIRREDKEIKALVGTLDSADTSNEVSAERAFLTELGGGCQVPIGALAHIQDKTVYLTGLIAALDGSQVIKVQGQIPAEKAAELGHQLGRQALEQGGRQILAAITNNLE